MLDVVCWLWKPNILYRSQYGAEHVNTLRSMVARNFNQPHRFSVITDQPDLAYHPGIRVIPLWDDFSTQESVYGPESPNCHRRLKAFSKEMAHVIGERFVSVDLDCVIVDDMAPVWNRTDDFVIWGEDNRRTPYNGSMWMMTAGSRSHVWEDFIVDPQRAIRWALGSGFFGSDQAWMCYALGGNEKRWTSDDGVYSYRMHVQRNGGKMPAAARIVMFEGNYDPWNPAAQRTSPWIAEHYR